ncbi:hypothetical protein BGZ83_009357 [Gryganskiella cystojenkinii]|nr:hypothetical protein BGZ83_009357 [Gryganskiella cystojenkinii]
MSHKQILVVFGATGNQGGSVVSTFVEDPELAKKYHIRAVTRDINKPEAKALQAKGAEVVQGDSDDAESLPRVLKGADSVFIVTVSVFDEHLKEREFHQGRAIADAAVAAGVKQIVFSSLPHASHISHNKYNVAVFDSKYKVQRYIQALPIKSTFFVPGSFMQNFKASLHPKPVGDGTFAISAPYNLTTELPLMSALDSGKWVATLVEHPDKYNGVEVSAAVRLYSMDEIVKTISKVTGKTVKFNKISIEAYKSHLPPGAAEPLAAQYEFVTEFGYFGPETKTLIEASQKLARGHLTTFEEFVVKSPFHLQ